ncbi:hypothetical protein NK639_26205 [Pseudomonas sp. ZM24]|nr:hypothetical protein [Pseudomonas triclosanedens]
MQTLVAPAVEFPLNGMGMDQLGVGFWYEKAAPCPEKSHNAHLSYLETPNTHPEVCTVNSLQCSPCPRRS